MSFKEHKSKTPTHIKLGVVTVSSSRNLQTDKSGQWITKTAKKEGCNVVAHHVVPDELNSIQQTVSQIMQEHSPDVLILTGGTGITQKDVTIEAIRPLFTKELSAFGVLFTQLSYEEIDTAAMLSRATAGIIDKTVIFCIPGSINACKLACNMLIFPELGHIVKHIQE
ncbi:MAG: MogA/MoaB family molybdenum cofactor biosynthesis protein [Desulfobacterales bacterium]|nr:MogA/MoaB family molybdenum cofactor biosynthesis protein [Desulfobacterales bacterium]